MEQKSHTKRRVVIFVVLLCMFLLVGLVSSNQRRSVVPQDGKPIVSEESCYIWNTEAGDTATLRFIVTGLGDSVTGTFNYVPAEKDKKVGSFSGSISPVDDTQGANIIHGWWMASAEGVTNKEEILVNVGGKTAAVGFGEMKQAPDGSYMYADASTLSYTPTLQQTSCDDAAVN